MKKSIIIAFAIVAAVIPINASAKTCGPVPADSGYGPIIVHRLENTIEVKCPEIEIVAPGDVRYSVSVDGVSAGTGSGSKIIDLPERGTFSVQKKGTYDATFSGCTGNIDYEETATCTITKTVQEPQLAKSSAPTITTSDADRIAQLETRISQLEGRVGALERMFNGVQTALANLLTAIVDLLESKGF